MPALDALPRTAGMGYGTLPAAKRDEAPPPRHLYKRCCTAAAALGALGYAAAARRPSPPKRLRAAAAATYEPFLAPGETLERPFVAASAWTAGPAKNATRLEEHYLARTHPADYWSGQVFVKEAYAFWRSGRPASNTRGSLADGRGPFANDVTIARVLCAGTASGARGARPARRTASP